MSTDYEKQIEAEATSRSNPTEEQLDDRPLSEQQDNEEGDVTAGSLDPDVLAEIALDAQMDEAEASAELTEFFDHSSADLADAEAEVQASGPGPGIFDNIAEEYGFGDALSPSVVEAEVLPNGDVVPALIEFRPGEIRNEEFEEFIETIPDWKPTDDIRVTEERGGSEHDLECSFVETDNEEYFEFTPSGCGGKVRFRFIAPLVALLFLIAPPAMAEGRYYQPQPEQPQPEQPDLNDLLSSGEISQTAYDTLDRLHAETAPWPTQGASDPSVSPCGDVTGATAQTGVFGGGLTSVAEACRAHRLSVLELTECDYTGCTERYRFAEATYFIGWPFRMIGHVLTFGVLN